MNGIGLEPGSRREQEGMAMVLVLFFMIIAGVVGFVSFQRVKNDVNETGHNMKTTKSKFAGEAAAYMGLGIANKSGSGPGCVTHDSSGTVAAVGPGSCAATDLTQFDKVYASGEFKLDPATGWLVNTPGDTSEALSATLNEKLAIKIWQPTPTSVRVVGRGTVDGSTSDLQLFGDWTP